MPRNGILTNEEKARAVLTRGGYPGNMCHGLDESEIDELAEIYDECVAPELKLKDRIGAFSEARHKRLTDGKATDGSVDTERGKFFRLRVTPPRLPAPAPPTS